MCLRLSQFSQLSFIQYTGIFGLPISRMIIVRIRLSVLYLNIIIKSQVWPICQFLGLGHETMTCPVCLSINLLLIMSSLITSSNGNTFRVAGLLCGEFTSHRWIPHTKARDVELFFLRSAPEPTVEQTMATPVTWNAIALIMTWL